MLNLIQYQDDEAAVIPDPLPVIPDPDPESHRTFRDNLCSPVDKGILNQVQDDEGVIISDISLKFAVGLVNRCE